MDRLEEGSKQLEGRSGFSSLRRARRLSDAVKVDRTLHNFSDLFCAREL